MKDQSKKTNNLNNLILILTIVSILMLTIYFITAPTTSTDTTSSSSIEYTIEEVRERIEDYLYEEYGEEFVVDRIGQRRMGNDLFYQARIYPKSIIGTNRQRDDYYYASASIDILSSGELGGVGDSYSYVVRNIDVENYLLSESKNIFGERVLLKVDVQHKVTGDGSWWAGYKSNSLREMREYIENDPERHRIELDLDVYVFKRIENEAEKEERREQIFEYVQYLKEVGLFEYLEMRIFTIDERILAPSYSDFSRELRLTPTVTKEVEGQESRTVQLPPMELRERMSRELQKEIDRMSKEEMIASIDGIRKDDLTYEGIRKNNTQYRVLVYSKGMMKERYTSSYKAGSDNVKDYDHIKDIVLDRSLVYTYID